MVTMTISGRFAYITTVPSVIGSPHYCHSESWLDDDKCSCSHCRDGKNGFGPKWQLEKVKEKIRTHSLAADLD